MSRCFCAIALIAIGIVVNSAGILLVPVAGFAGVVALNIVFVLLPGIFISYKAGLHWPQHYGLCPAAMAVAPAVGAIFSALLGDATFPLVFVVMTTVLFSTHWFSAYVAIQHR